MVDAWYERSGSQRSRQISGVQLERPLAPFRPMSPSISRCNWVGNRQLRRDALRGPRINTESRLRENSTGTRPHARPSQRIEGLPKPINTYSDRQVFSQKSAGWASVKGARPPLEDLTLLSRILALRLISRNHRGDPVRQSAPPDGAGRHILKHFKPSRSPELGLDPCPNYTRVSVSQRSVVLFDRRIDPDGVERRMASSS